MKLYKILVVNIGSTSTKLAYYEDKECKLKTTLEHPVHELAAFDDMMDQDHYRRAAIEAFLKDKGIQVSELDAISCRGGHSKPLEGGVYRINETMLAQQASGLYGRHPADIGTKIAYQMAAENKLLAVVVDPPVTDEFTAVARLSGHPELPRQSRFQALSHRATGKRYARDNGRKYEELNLVIAHMGGGITVAVHRQGKMIDATNGIDGEGPFSTNRTGGLPVGALVDLCFSGRYSYKKVQKMINGEGGLTAYLKENDVRTIEVKAATDDYYALCLEAMIYQTCKEIGAMATVLAGKVDAIVITGGIAHSQKIMAKIKERVGFIAPITLYPGENEMDALALGALEAIRGNEPIKSL
ncbi:butyrate kinase [Sporomusa acidovorans]|uniref:Probable butyrate kinase n=1 Tax=Sporomusa acidovorans (strain ATCC 49682 / DSM 3132 / Mol) TaxID=1123286 RepID=A0ABZ3J8E1_SPOA4|nr:butyrate kinase [Sporomusa acidovorans]OZC16660.1 butyrate kinase 2 [Sporomusa acidovorans DSM 3132]SDE07083.1 butyrate kinase [Sporomusa acidovorans]